MPPPAFLVTASARPAASPYSRMASVIISCFRICSGSCFGAFIAPAASAAVTIPDSIQPAPVILLRYKDPVLLTSTFSGLTI